MCTFFKSFLKVMQTSACKITDRPIDNTILLKIIIDLLINLINFSIYLYFM